MGLAMATDTARTITTRPRRLWQVPAFLLGAAALAGVHFGRPYWHDDHRAAEHHLRAAREALEQSPPDAATAVHRGSRALDAADPRLAGEAQFVVGSARLRLADDPACANAAGEREQARKHLERADQLGVPDADRPK